MPVTYTKNRRIDDSNAGTRADEISRSINDSKDDSQPAVIRSYHSSHNSPKSPHYAEEDDSLRTKKIPIKDIDHIHVENIPTEAREYALETILQRLKEITNGQLYKTIDAESFASLTIDANMRR